MNGFERLANAMVAGTNPSSGPPISGVNPDNIRQWNVLQGIQDRNETLFYK